jgi:hypothetical protein
MVTLPVFSPSPTIVWHASRHVSGFCGSGRRRRGRAHSKRSVSGAGGHCTWSQRRARQPRLCRLGPGGGAHPWGGRGARCAAPRQRPRAPRRLRTPRPSPPHPLELALLGVGPLRQQVCTLVNLGAGGRRGEGWGSAARDRARVAMWRWQKRQGDRSGRRPPQPRAPSPALRARLDDAGAALADAAALPDLAPRRVQVHLSSRGERGCGAGLCTLTRAARTGCGGSCRGGARCKLRGSRARTAPGTRVLWGRVCHLPQPLARSAEGNRAARAAPAAPADPRPPPHLVLEHHRAQLLAAGAGDLHVGRLLRSERQCDGRLAARAGLRRAACAVARRRSRRRPRAAARRRARAHWPRLGAGRHRATRERLHGAGRPRLAAVRKGAGGVIAGGRERAWIVSTTAME